MAERASGDSEWLREANRLGDTMARLSYRASDPTVFILGTAKALKVVAYEVVEVARTAGVIGPEVDSLDSFLRSDDALSRIQTVLNGLSFYQAIALLGAALVATCMNDPRLEDEVQKMKPRERT